MAPKPPPCPLSHLRLLVSLKFICYHELKGDTECGGVGGMEDKGHTHMTELNVKRSITKLFAAVKWKWGSNCVEFEKMKLYFFWLT